MKIVGAFRSRQYLYQVYLAIALAAITVITAMLWLVYHALKDNMVQLDHKMSVEMLTQIQNNVEAMGNNNNNICMSAFYNNDVQHLMYTRERYDYEVVQSINRFAGRFIGANPSIHSAYIYNGRQNRYFSTNNGINNVDEDFLARMERGEAFSANIPVVRYLDEEVVLTFCIADSYKSESPAASALYMNIRADWLFSYMDTVNRLDDVEEGSLLVFDSAGHCINHFSNTPDAILRIQEALVPYEAAEDRQIQVMTLEIDSKPYTGTLLHETRYGWELVRVYPYEQLFSGLRQTRMVILLANIVTAALILILFFLLAKGIYRPVNRLLKQVGHGAAGSDRQSEFEFLEQYYQLSKNELQQLQSEADTRSLVVREHMLRKLVLESDTFSQAEIRMLRGQYDVELDFDESLSLLVLSIDDFSTVRADYNLDTDKSLLVFGMMNIVGEILSRHCKNECNHLDGSTIVILYNATKQGGEELLLSLLKNARQAAERIFGLSFSVSMNGTPGQTARITECYTALADQLKSRFMLGSGCIVAHAALQQVSGKLFVDYSFDSEDLFLEHLSALRIDQAGKELGCLIHSIGRLEYQSAVIAAVHLSKSIQHAVFELNRTRSEPILIRQYIDVWNRLPTITLAAFQRSVEELLAGLPADDTGAVPKQQMLAEVVRDYIESSYSDYGLSAASLADTLGMSASHVGRVFKSHYKMTIPEYINHVRLHKAMAWMQSSDLTIQELMKRVGYQNEAYFYKVFKDKFKMSPRAYIQSLSQDVAEEAY